MPKPSGNVLSRASEKAKSAVNRTARGVASTVTGGGEFARKLFKDPKGAASDLGGLLASGTGGMGQALQLMSALTSGPNGGLDAVLVLGRAVRDSNDTKKRVAYVKMLRRSLDVLMRLAKAATHRPAVVDFLVQQVDSKLSEKQIRVQSNHTAGAPESGRPPDIHRRAFEHEERGRLAHWTTRHAASRLHPWGAARCVVVVVVWGCIVGSGCPERHQGLRHLGVVVVDGSRGGPHLERAR